MSEQRSRRQRLIRLGVSSLILLTVLGMVLGMVGSALAAPSTAPSTAPPGRAGAASSSTSASPTSPALSAAPTTPPAPVILIATTHLSWADLLAEPSDPAQAQDLAETLLGMASAGAVANLVQRTVSEVTCPADAWLSLSAGARTRALPTSPAPGQGCAWPSSWSDAVATSQEAGYGARPGSLADALARAGRSTLAVGEGASLMLTTSDGVAPDTAPTLAQAAEAGLADLTVVDATDPQVLLASLRLAASVEGARVVVASIADPTDPGPQVLLLPAGTTSDGAPTSGPTRPAAAAAEDAGALVASPSTRRAGLVQLADLSATVLAALGAQVPPEMTGRALTLPAVSPAVGTPPAGAHRAPVEALADEALHAKASQMTTLPVGGALAIATLACLAAAAVGLRGPAGRRHLRGTGLAAAWVAALPVGAWLGAVLPWWRAGASADGEPGWQVVPAALGASAVSALVFLAVLHGLVVVSTGMYERLAQRSHRSEADSAATPPPRLGPLTLPARTGTPVPALITVLLLAGATAVVLLADGATGARLGFNGVLGMNAIVAGRFYGLSNTAFALGAAALVVAVGAGAGTLVEAQPAAWQRRAAALVGVGVPGLVALVVVGLPSLGTDVGGALTLVAALTSLAVGLAGGRITWCRWIGVGAVAVAVVGVFGVVDHVTGSGTHMGRFVDQLQDGTAATTIRRKALALVAPFMSSPAALGALLVAAAVIATAWWWYARERRACQEGASRYASLDVRGPVPGWLVPVLRALLVLVVVEVLVNDSGASMAVLSVSCAAPLLLALGCAHLRSRALRARTESTH